MEMVELLFGLWQACGCFLEVAAGATNVGAGVTGYKAHQIRKQRLQAGPGQQPGSSYVFVAFLGLLLFGALLTGLVIWKYTR